jgi:catechol 2,3-dioxygenase-like lactoylglutathione lyase family enzyme
LQFDSEQRGQESKKHKLFFPDGRALHAVCYDTSVIDDTIIGIHHIQLAMPVGGEELARGFYFGLLGIPEVQKPPDLAKRGGVWFETNSIKIHVGVEHDFRPARKAHPGLLVRDLSSLSKRLAETGYEIIIGEPLEGHAHIYVNDPFGNRLELLQTV